MKKKIITVAFNAKGLLPTAADVNIHCSPTLGERYIANQLLIQIIICPYYTICASLESATDGEGLIKYPNLGHVKRVR